MGTSFLCILLVTTGTADYVCPPPKVLTYFDIILLVDVSIKPGYCVAKTTLSVLFEVCVGI